MIAPFLPNGIALKIAQAAGPLGGAIWPAAYAFCHHLNEERVLSDLFDSSRSHQAAKILELGSGTGVVGLFVAATCQQALASSNASQQLPHVILSDHCPPVASAMPFVPYTVDGMHEDTFFDENETSHRLLDLLETNVHSNREHFPDIPITVEELDWKSPTHRDELFEKHGTMDLIVASDVTYFMEMHEALAATIATFIGPKQEDSSGEAKCLIAHQKRFLDLKGRDSQLLHFSKALEEQGLDIQVTSPSGGDAAQNRLEDTGSGSVGGYGEIAILDIRKAK